MSRLGLTAAGLALLRTNEDNVSHTVSANDGTTHPFMMATLTVAAP